MDVDPLLRLETSSSRISACDALINETKAKIWECQRKIFDLEEEMIRLREELGGHREMKKQIDRIRRKLTNTTSTIRRTPPEIIALFFTFSLWDEYGSFHAEWLLKLCSVSRLWRDTALSTPSLWRTLHIGFDRFSKRRSPVEASDLFTSALDR
ncbi:hypothetical protein BKA70DRAFT_1279033, partial [Coprinopsis sp. MPI-PUGE-AT-0042]